MSHSLIQDWLAKYKALPQTELKQYGNDILQKRDLATALYNLFENDISNEVVAPVCHQLFDFFRSPTPELRYFSIGMIPMLSSTYLTTISHTDKKKSAAVEACLLGMYNLVVVNDKGQAQKDEFIIPTLAASSIYHEPPSLAALALTESTLLRYHSDMPTIITIGPQPQVESITAQNRFSVLTCLLRCFNADIEHVPPHAHRMLCRMCSKIVRMGFVGESNELAPSRANSSVSASVSMVGSVRDFSESGRVAVTGAFLTELTCGVYHTMYNGQTQRGMLALNDLHQRACFELYSEVILLTNAIKNGLKQSPPGAHKNNPMGISMSSSPHQAGNISKCAITNASFRAKKLPEDIEVPELMSLSDNPPRYEDITEQDSMEGKSRHANPIKSIIKKSDKTKASLNQHHSTLSILSEELNTHTDLSLISLQMSEGDAPPRRVGKEITLDVLSHRHRQETPHKRTCGFPDKSCCCASTALTEKLSDSYVALVDGKSGNGPQRRGYESTFSDSGNPDSLSTQL